MLNGSQPVHVSNILDHTVLHSEHLTCTAAELKNNNNLLLKLVGSVCYIASTCNMSAVLLSYRILLPSLVEMLPLVSLQHLTEQLGASACDQVRPSLM